MNNTESIYQIILRRAKEGSASFASVQLDCQSAGLDFRGDMAITWPEEGYDNLILWSGVSNDFINAFNRVISKHSLTLRGTDYLVYLADGCVCSGLPLAKGKKKYKTPHFLPTVFETPKVAHA
jgi:hypothetical protein